MAINFSNRKNLCLFDVYTTLKTKEVKSMLRGTSYYRRYSCDRQNEQFRGFDDYAKQNGITIAITYIDKAITITNNEEACL